MRVAASAISALSLCLAMVSAAIAQPEAVHKTTLQDLPFPPPAHHTMTVRTVIDQGGVVARHTHPGAEMAYVVDGHAMLKVAGRPDQLLAPGDSFAIPPGVVHEVKNTGAGALTIVSTYVVQTGKPISTPAD